jgi:OOP family OmpA-OmpF porin
MIRSACPVALGALLSTGICTSSEKAYAQAFDSAVRIDQLQPASAGSPFVRAEGPRERFDAGVGFAARVVGDYMFDPLRARVDTTTAAGTTTGETVSVVKHAALVHAGGQFSPVHWLNLELNVPFAVMEKGTGITSVNGEPLAAGATGLGDIRLGVHALPINGRAFDLQLGGRFWAPTGSEKAYLQSASRLFRMEAVVAAAGELDSFLYGCTLGISPLWFAGRDGDRLAASCAAGLRVGSHVRVAIEPHVAAFTFRAEPSQPTLAGLGDARKSLSFEPMGSLAFQAGNFHIGLAGGAGLGNAPGTATARGMLSLTYASQASRAAGASADGDQDLDGISDSYDACPTEAGPEDRRGCPEKRDQDGDGIIEDDACPTEAGARYDDPKANGCPDADNDHIANPVDACPIEPGDPPRGCPEFARLEGKSFKVDPPLAFEKTADRLSAASTMALVEIVRTLRANPTLGHVSVKLGTKGTSNKVSDARAAAVLAVLNEQNLESTRYELVLEAKLPGGVVEVVVSK